MMNILKSEFYKLKHTWIPWAHFILPVLYALIFYGAAIIYKSKKFFLYGYRTEFILCF